jgi:Fe-S-cluster-containing hydrogenase component 2
MFVVNREVCRGCGTCVEDCPVGAISMVDDFAFINQEDCTACGLCVNSCPQGAIIEVLEPEVEALAPWPPAPAEQAIMRPSSPPAMREPALPPAPLTNRLLATAGVTLAFLGREIVPRLAVALVDAVERRLSQDATVTPTRRSPGGAGGQRGRRRRRGRGR